MAVLAAPRFRRRGARRVGGCAASVLAVPVHLAEPRPRDVQGHALDAEARLTGTRISVRLTPRGGRDAIDGWDGDVLRARVSAPAAEGRANAALVRLLARALGLAPSSVQVISGRQSRGKK